MALEPRDLSSNHLNSGSSYVNSATLLRKEGSNISAESWPKTPLWKQKPTNHQENQDKNNLENYLHLYPTLPTLHQTCTCAFCALFQQTHLDLSDQNHICCTSPRKLANLHSMPHVRHLKLRLKTLSHLYQILTAQGLW